MASAAKWVTRQANATLASGGEELWQRVLKTEWGGMNEVLFNLYAVTGDVEHLQTGRLFNHWAWSAPLAAGVDNLGGNHANTHIPEVLGNAVGYELTGNATDRAITLQFFAAVTQNHSWATGGSNDGEYWGGARRARATAEDRQRTARARARSHGTGAALPRRSSGGPLTVL